MKKILASATIFVYFAFACGIMVSYHFCMARYSSFELYKPSTDWCGTCGMHTNGKGCCHDEVKIVKISDDYQTSSANYGIEKIRLFTPTTFELLSAALFDENRVLYKTDHSPPLPLQDVYLRNRVFRI